MWPASMHKHHLLHPALAGLLLIYFQWKRINNHSSGFGPFLINPIPFQIIYIFLSSPLQGGDGRLKAQVFLFHLKDMKT